MSRMRDGARLAFTALAALTMVAAGSHAALAQAPAAGAAASACNINTTDPKEIGLAYVAVAQAAQAKGADAVDKQVRTVMKNADQNIAKGQNMIAREELMGQALVYWLGQPNAPSKVTRGQLGLTTEPDKEVDLYVAIDSLFKQVETAQPGCVKELSGWRRHQPWINAMTAAQNAIQANSLDTAEALVRKAMILTPNNDVVYTFLGVIANRRGDRPAEEAAWQKVLEYTSPTDTADADSRQTAMNNLAQAYANDAMSTTDSTARKAAANKAIAEYHDVMMMNPPPAPDALSAARENTALMYQLAGELNLIPTIYTDLLANPTKYSAADLYQAGTMAAEVDSSAQAVRLFEAALAKAPYDKDILYNLGAAYMAVKRVDGVMPVLQRLMSIDPENSDNLELMAFYYNTANDVEKDPARKKVLTDSLVYFSNAESKMTHKVGVSAFEHTDSTATAKGFVANTGDAPQTFTLHFHFLDAQGNVVSSADQTVQAPAKASTPFTVTATGKGIVAWKYDPFPPS